MSSHGAFIRIPLGPDTGLNYAQATIFQLIANSMVFGCEENNVVGISPFASCGSTFELFDEQIGERHERQEKCSSCARVIDNDWVNIIGRAASSDEDVESNASFP